ncbi:MAG: RNA polymerase sigma factor [Planctomycetota bacterium]
MQHRSERQNLKNIRKGRREAYEAVISQHYRSIYRFMAYLTGDEGLAEDLTQETFTSAWANIDSYKGRASLGTWLHKIAYHKFIDSKRGLKHHATFMAGLKEKKKNSDESYNPLYQLTSDEHTRLLHKAICSLESPEYIVIVLHYIQELSFREMAKVLDEPAGTVKWRTSHALKRLKKLLSGRV